MKSMVHKILAISLAVWLIPAAAMAAMVYNAGGYAPNTRSPVVGGWVQYTATNVAYAYSIHPIRPFGDVDLSGGHWSAGGTYMPGNYNLNYFYWYSQPGRTSYHTRRRFRQPLPAYSSIKSAFPDSTPRCPRNTAEISVGNGYLADNGVWYNSVYVSGGWRPASKTIVCATTDTGSGWYGAQ